MIKGSHKICWIKCHDFYTTNPQISKTCHILVLMVLALDM